MTPIATKKLGTNPDSGLDQQVVVWQLTIDSKAEKVVVVFNVETLSPKGTVVATSDNMTYTRYNSPEELFRKGEIITPPVYYTLGDIVTPAVLYTKGDVITPAVLDDNGVDIKTPAVISDGTEIKTAAVLAGMYTEKVPGVYSDGTQVKKAANMKFDALRASAPGQQIAGLIGQDMDMIKSIDTMLSDLSQD